ncbi:MAG: hypothetical protein ACR2ID_12140 [Chthoniobacterales bacterium]
MGLIARPRKYVLTITGITFVVAGIVLFAVSYTGDRRSTVVAVLGSVFFGLICIAADRMKRNPYLGVAAVIVLAFAGGFVIGGLVAEPNEWPPRAVDYREYALLTWQQRSGDVCFKLMFNYQLAREIHSLTSRWGGQCGVSQLKQALRSLPEGSYVYWCTWPPTFDYPQSVDTVDLIRVAQDKGVTLQLTPATH